MIMVLLTPFSNLQRPQHFSATVAGEMSEETGEGETSGEDFRDGDYSDIRTSDIND